MFPEEAAKQNGWNRMSDEDSRIKNEVRERREFGRHALCSSKEILHMYKYNLVHISLLPFVFLLIQMVDLYTHGSDLLYFENSFLISMGKLTPIFF